MVTYILGFSLLLATGNSRGLGGEQISPTAQKGEGDGESGLTSLAFSKRGDFFATASEDEAISIRDKHGRVMATHTVHKFEQGWPTALAFDPNDDERIFVATRHGLFGWEWKNKAKLQKLFANDPPDGKKVFDCVAALAISPAGRHIALIDQGDQVVVIEMEPKQMKVKVASVAQEARKRGVDIFTIKHGGLAFAPDSSILAHTTGDEISLYDVNTRKEMRRLKGHTGVVGSLSFIDNDTLVSGSWDGTCRIWAVKDGSSKVVPSTARPEACPLVACSSDGKRFACEFGGEIAVLSFPGREEVKRIRGPASGFTGIAFLPDGRSLITTGEAPRAQFWDIQQGKELKRKSE